jgi:amidase
VATVTWRLFFPTGAAEFRETAATGAEDIVPALRKHLDIFDIQSLSAAELLELNTRQSAYQFQMTDLLTSTSRLSHSGMPIYCLMCPVSPSVSFPHDFPAWWGSTSLFNLLDYPSTGLPVKDFIVSATNDPRSLKYRLKDNFFDQITHDLCKHSPSAITFLKFRCQDLNTYFLSRYTGTLYFTAYSY